MQVAAARLLCLISLLGALALAGPASASVAAGGVEAIDLVGAQRLARG